MCDSSIISQQVLNWYDTHARILPWRVGPADRKCGIQPDPYRVWLSEIMLQQTTVVAVQSYFERFTTLWPSVQALAAAEDVQVMAEWAGLGYYARARNLLKAARVVANEMNGIFPKTLPELIKLPGVGPYTAAAVAAIAFDQPANVVDGNIERVMARLHNVRDPLPGVKKYLATLASTLSPSDRPGDYAQALMDLGATVCTPRNPSCDLCPLREQCQGYAKGGQNELPRRAVKQAKPIRYGYAYVARRADGAFLLERRPDSGLLGGMLGWPGSAWTDDPPRQPPFPADWQQISEEVRHTFTHFHLRLKVLYAEVPQTPPVLVGHFIPSSEFSRNALPTIMRKVFDLVADRIEPIS